MPHCGNLVELGGVLFKLDGVTMIVSDPQGRRPTARAVYGRIHISMVTDHPMRMRLIPQGI